MSVVKGLERCKDILLEIAEKRTCAKITGYDRIAIESFVGDIEKAIKRYKSESERVKKIQRRARTY